VAEYCHNSCSKCPSFARTYAWRRPCPSMALSMMVWSMPCQTCTNAASVHNACLHKIDCYLQRRFSRNWKLKQQVSKLTALKLGRPVCSKINACYIFVCIFFQICQHLKFCRVMLQHTEGVMGSIIWLLLEILFSVQL